MANVTAFLSGHLDLTAEEFAAHYAPRLDMLARSGASFIVGDAPGCDALCQRHLRGLADAGLLDPARVLVYHMLMAPRHNAGFATRGGFPGDGERDRAMTLASQEDVLWVRPGREKSGTARNRERRTNLSPRRDQRATEASS